MIAAGVVLASRVLLFLLLVRQLQVVTVVLVIDDSDLALGNLLLLLVEVAAQDCVLCNADNGNAGGENHDDVRDDGECRRPVVRVDR